MKTTFKPKAPMLALLAVVATISFSDFVTNKVFANECNSDNIENICSEDSNHESTVESSAPEVKAEVKAEKPMITINIDDKSKPIVESDFTDVKPNKVKVPLDPNRPMITVNIDDKSKPIIESDFTDEQPYNVQPPLSPNAQTLESTPEITFEQSAFYSRDVVHLVLDIINKKIQKMNEQISDLEISNDEKDEIIQAQISLLESDLSEISSLKSKVKDLGSKLNSKSSENEKLQKVVSEIVSTNDELKKTQKALEDKIAELKKQLESKDEVIATHKAELEQAGEELELAWNEATKYQEIACEYNDKIGKLETQIAQLEENTRQQLQMMQMMQQLSQGLQNPGFNFVPSITNANPMNMFESFMLGQQMMSLNNALNPNSLLGAFSRGNNIYNNTYNMYGQAYPYQNGQPMVYAPIPYQAQEIYPASQYMTPGQNFTHGINNGMRAFPQPIGVNWNQVQPL